MSCKRWHSKKDVINDLAIATGKRVRDFNEDYMIIGEQPPPRHMANEEAEAQVLRISGGRVTSSQDIVKPDLQGITKMLRMVDQFYERPSNVSHVDVKNNKETNTVVSISKLNPDVAEFVPKNINTNNDLNKLVNVGVNEDVNKGLSPKSDVNETSKKKQNGNDKGNHLPSSVISNNIKEINETDSLRNNTSNRIDTSRLTPVQMQEMREQLKTKISVTSNTNCVKVKRERNLAIATLVKLHCEAPKTNSEEDKPKLIAPEYYEKSLLHHEKIAKENHFIEKLDNVPISSITQKHDIATVNSVIDKKHEPLVDKNTSDFSPIENKTSDNTVKTFEIISDKNIQKQETNYEITKDVKESIEKVENWLNSPTKKATKGPSIYLGPVTFKRKVNSKPMSPISIDSDTNPIKKMENFVPSDFANELTKKYMERSKAKEIVEQNIWTKLESELKAKDEIIKKQRLQMSNSSLETNE